MSLRDILQRFALLERLCMRFSHQLMRLNGLLSLGSVAHC
jgi:hypothetical protein